MSAAERIPSSDRGRVGPGPQDAAADDLAARGREVEDVRPARWAPSGIEAGAHVRITRSSTTGTGGESIRTIARPCRPKPAAAPPRRQRRLPRAEDGGIETYVRRLYPALLEARPGLRISMFVNEHGRRAARGRALGGRGRARDASAARPPRHARAHRGAPARGRSPTRRGCEVLHSVALTAPLRLARGKRRHDRRHDLAAARRIRAAPTRACSGARSSSRRRAAPTG